VAANREAGERYLALSPTHGGGPQARHMGQKSLQNPQCLGTPESTLRDDGQDDQRKVLFSTFRLVEESQSKEIGNSDRTKSSANLGDMTPCNDRNLVARYGR
jgi:hypothetical protein